MPASGAGHRRPHTKQGEPIVVIESVVVRENETITSLEFVPIKHIAEDREQSDKEETYMFTLQPPFEWVVCVRYHVVEENAIKRISAVQLQTNLGRRSRFYGLASATEAGAIGTRDELVAPAGCSVIGFDKNNFQLKTGPVPPCPKKKLRKLLLLPSVRSLLLKTPGSGPSVAMQMLHGGRKAVALHAVRHGLASKMLSAGEDGDALIRLMLDGEQHVERRSSSSMSTARRVSSLFSVSSSQPRQRRPSSAADEEIPEDEEAIAFPPSIIRAICDKPDSFDYSLMDMLSAGRERDGRPPLMRLLFESGMAKVIFYRRKGVKCLAELMMTPDRIRGLRSLMQLLTDDEALDDVNRPSLMRSMLAGEEEVPSRPSLLRLMFWKTPGKTVTSLMDELVRGELEAGDCIARRMLMETSERPIALGRLFFSDTPGGKPALAKYAFGGEFPQSSSSSRNSSLMRLMLQGEAREQNSLLRLLVAFRGANDKSLMDLLTSGQPSLMDILLRGEESATEMSLARLMLGTTFTIQNGRLVMGSMLGSASSSVASLSSKKSVSTASVPNVEKNAETLAQEQVRKRLQRGMTIAKACMLGEEDGGPGLSVMRVMLLGEEQGVSVLRLLMTGEEVGEVSPLRIIFTGWHAAFVAASMARDSTKDLEREGGLLELARNPKRWGDALQKITNAVVESVNESHSASGTWKDSFEKLVEMGKKQLLQSTDAWQENIAFLYTAFARMRSMGPEFARTWKKQWLIIAKEIRLTGDRVRPESPWKGLAPHFALLVESIAEQQWQKVFVNAAHTIEAVEKAAGGGSNAKDDNMLSMTKVLTLIDEVSAWAPRWF